MGGARVTLYNLGSSNRLVQMQALHLEENVMLGARVGLVWFVGFSLAIVGCGKPTDDPRAIVEDFRQSLDAGGQKYKGKTLRLRVEKVTKVEESSGDVSVQGNAGTYLLIIASVTDAAEKTKALKLKKGEPATFEGEFGSANPGDAPGRGIIWISSAKVAP